MAISESALHSKLDALYHTMQQLTPTSTSDDFDTFGAFFDKNCTVYLKSMREYASPSIGRQAAIDDLKESLKECQLGERRVLSRSATADGSTIFCEMENRLKILGETLDPYFETAVAVFNDEGLITQLKHYGFRSHIVAIIQDKTGVGPYAK